GAPAVVDALAGQCKVKAEIESRMRFGVIGNFRKPRARNHDAGGVDEPGVQSFDRCGVHGMSHTDVVGVDNQELGVAGEAEPFGKSLATILRARIEKGTSKAEEKQGCDAASNH